MDKAIVLGDVVRRIAAETVPGSEKERLALKLAAFVLGMHVDCLQILVNQERHAVECPVCGSTECVGCLTCNPMSKKNLGDT